MGETLVLTSQFGGLVQQVAAIVVMAAFVEHGNALQQVIEPIFDGLLLVEGLEAF